MAIMILNCIVYTDCEHSVGFGVLFEYIFRLPTAECLC